MVATSSFNVNSPAFVPSALKASEQNQHLQELSNQEQVQQQSLASPTFNKQPIRNRQPRGRNSSNKKNHSYQNDTESHRNKPQNSSASNPSNNNKTASSKRHSKKKPPTSPSSNSYDTGLGDDDFPTDLKALNAKGKRGQVSISHLLEFSTTDDSRQRRFSGGSSSHSSGGTRPLENGSWKKTKSRSSYSYYNQFSSVGPPNNLSFIQTTCKFFLDPETPQLYNNLLTNPNQIIPMDKVVRILAKPSSCPICLEEVAKAPRMLPCGHVMCHPCLLRFLDPATSSSQDVTKGTSSDFFANQVRKLEDAKKPRECPLCFEHVRLQDTKPVTFSSFDAQFDTPKENTDVVMKLMFRPHVDIHNNGEDKQMVSMPVSTLDLSSDKFNSIPIVSPDALNYSRFMYPSYDYLLEQYETEIKDLEIQRDTESLIYPDDLYNLKYFNMAIESIKQSISDLQRSTKYDIETIISADSIAKMSLNGNRNTNSLTTEQYLDSFDGTSAYYYYQTAFQSDIKYVLAPLDARILFHEFQDYKNLPSSIVVRVERIVYGHYVDADMKKKLKYLNHLPDHTEVAFIECQWLNNNKTNTPENDSPDNSGVFTLSQETLSKFQDELVNRVKTRKEKERFENRQARRIQKIQDKQFKNEIWGSALVEDPSIYQEELKSYSAFPSLKKDEDNFTKTQEGSDNNISEDYHHHQNNINNNSLDESNQHEQIKSQTREEKEEDPIKKFAAAVILGNRQTKTVWGTDAVFTKSEEEALLQAQQEAEQAGWTDFSKIFELYKQKMESSSSSSSSATYKNSNDISSDDGGELKGSKKNKKKKQKRLVLMSTSR